MHFTGKEHDTETNLENFGARYSSSAMGRFMSPDPANIAGDLLEWESPQSWNAYSYVQNDPTNATDPDGLDCVYVIGNGVYYNTGNCTPGMNGTYVNGTIDPKSATYNSTTGTVGINYTATNGGPGSLTLGGVYPQAGPSDADRLNTLGFAGQIADNGVKAGALFMAQNAALEGAGRLAWLGVEALLASRAASPAVRVVINWAHRLQDIRPGHLPPPGTQAEIQQAVEGAVRAGKYTTSSSGVISGTTEIHGVEVGFRGKWSAVK